MFQFMNIVEFLHRHLLELLDRLRLLALLDRRHLHLLGRFSQGAQCSLKEVLQVQQGEGNIVGELILRSVLQFFIKKLVLLKKNSYLCKNF